MSRVKAVEVKSPPKTTIDNGCRISFPGPPAKTKGAKPKAEVNAVIKIALSRSIEPLIRISLMGHSFRKLGVVVIHQQQTIPGCNPKQGDKANE